jgi:hypothetical protein
VLFDFKWCRRATVIDGVSCGGHSRSFATGPARDALIDRLVAPILRRCAAEPAILAWDLLNEPEWVTRGAGEFRPFAPVRGPDMREFIRGAARAVHTETRHLVTVGLASSKGLGLVAGLGLDVYQVHWYDRRERRAPLAAPIAASLDRPVWLGEFPTAGSGRTAREIVESARQAGYGAAFAWSAEAVDGHSGLGWPDRWELRVRSREAGGGS